MTVLYKRKDLEWRPCRHRPGVHTESWWDWLAVQPEQDGRWKMTWFDANMERQADYFATEEAAKEAANAVVDRTTRFRFLVEEVGTIEDVRNAVKKDAIALCRETMMSQKLSGKEFRQWEIALMILEMMV